MHCCTVSTGCGLLNVSYISVGGTHLPLPARLSTRRAPVKTMRRVSDVRTRRRLSSSSSTTLVISRTSRATIGARAFSAAAITVIVRVPLLWFEELCSESHSLHLFFSFYCYTNKTVHNKVDVVSRGSQSFSYILTT